jgi:hypothetical protein
MVSSDVPLNRSATRRTTETAAAVLKDGRRRHSGPEARTPESRPAGQ